MKRYPYRSDYMLTHDIDWFFQCKGEVYHVASNGGSIPSEILSEKNFAIQERVYNYTSPTELLYVVNEQHIRDIILKNNVNNDGDQHYNDYIESFVSMAKKGFISLDRTLEGKYFWVAKPVNNNDDKDFIEILNEVVQFDEMPINYDE